MVRGIIHEFHLAGELIRLGCSEVVPSFLIKGSQDEIIADWDFSKIEVQCKTKVPGAGRRIHGDLFLELAGYIIADAVRDETHLNLRLTCTDRLRAEDLSALRSEVRKIPRRFDGALILLDGKYAVQALPLPGDLNGLTSKELADLISPGKHRLVDYGEVREIADREPRYYVRGMVEAESLRLGNVPQASFDSVRAAARQCSGNVPAVAAVHFTDSFVNWSQLTSQDSFYKRLTSIVMTEFPFLAAVIFSSEPPVRQLPKGGDVFCVRYIIDKRLPRGFPIDRVLESISGFETSSAALND